MKQESQVPDSVNTSRCDEGEQSLQAAARHIRPLRFQSLFVLGHCFITFKTLLGEILRLALPRNKDLPVPPQERSEERPGAGGQGREGVKGGEEMTSSGSAEVQTEQICTVWRKVEEKQEGARMHRREEEEDHGDM
ncbi:unnamed protein product [Pleuronectes platessa]|uniref:Uncharacterized protein n=1 Tax=Pleuronectes platessa TaxID=8262 RepID=A0A9N7TV02_PLEPL|nr:unnamed protein product [Pleuronectes platessa]